MAKRGRKKKPANGRLGRKAGDTKRGRKPIFTPAQLRVLDRLIKEALKEQLRAVARGL